MKQFKGTPGKWEYIREQVYHTVEVDGVIIAECSLDESMSEEAEANARLIASAPDMLEVLQWLDSVGGKGLKEHKEIKRVINKALGIN